MKSKPKLNDATELVSVRRQWNSWEIAQVYVGEVSNPLWDLVSGGVKESSPDALIFGYIWCDAIVSGSVAHSCLHGTAPHSIKICILRKDNSPRIYNHFLALVGPKPTIWHRGRLEGYTTKLNSSIEFWMFLCILCDRYVHSEICLISKILNEMTNASAPIMQYFKISKLSK